MAREQWFKWWSKSMLGPRNGKTGRDQRQKHTLQNLDNWGEQGNRAILRLGGLPGLRMGMMLADFQIAGRLEALRERLKSFVIYATLWGLICLR
jgi:hypothetical protein